MRGLRVLNALTPNIGPAERELWDLEKADGWDRYWRRQQFAAIPVAFALPIAAEYRKRWTGSGEREGNLYLLRVASRIKDLAADPNASDDDICSSAKRIADLCRNALTYSRNRPPAARRSTSR